MKQNELDCNILRGQYKIGGNLIEFSYGETKILAELGKELDGCEDTLSDMEKQVLHTEYDAVIISHYHADHAGLIGQKHDCPVYMGQGTRNILEAMCLYANTACPDNIKCYENAKPFYIGNIKVTPFLCDHSAFDSYMLLFEAGGKSCIYTGDFRFHGRKPKESLLNKLPKDVDVLIHEGTNLGQNKQCFSERELENKAVTIMKKSDKPVFVFQSGSNIDRLVSFYRASKRSGRIFYEDCYTALLATAAGGKIPHPDAFNDVYAFTPKRLKEERAEMLLRYKNKRGLQRIALNGKYTMTVRPSMLGYVKKLSEKMDLKGSTLIYSIWSGYKEKPDVEKFLTELSAMGAQIITLHTSGHASAEDIELLKKTVCAKEGICVHTEQGKAIPDSKN